MFTNKGRTPNDLPRRYWWARDELVRLRLENHELTIENIRLEAALRRCGEGLIAATPKGRA